MNEATAIPPGTICNECLYDAKIIANVSGFPKYLCWRCYSLMLAPPKKKPPVAVFGAEGQGVLNLTGTGR